MKTTNAMTLRLDTRLDERLTDASYDAGKSKAAWIRLAILRSLRFVEQANRNATDL